jgi:hypothetical protein
LSTIRGCDREGKHGIKGETSRLGGEARDTMKPYIDAVDSYLNELNAYLKALSKE